MIIVFYNIYALIRSHLGAGRSLALMFDSTIDSPMNRTNSSSGTLTTDNGHYHLLGWWRRLLTKELNGSL